MPQNDQRPQVDVPTERNYLDYLSCFFNPCFSLNQKFKGIALPFSKNHVSNTEVQISSVL